MLHSKLEGIEHRKTRVALIGPDNETLDNYETVINLSRQFKVVGKYLGGKSLLEDLIPKQPAIVVVSFELKEDNPIELTAKIKSNFEYLEIILTGLPPDPRTVFNALRAGASGALTADTGIFDILEALGELERGGAPLSSVFAKLIVKDYHLNSNSPMTKREIEILQMIAEGKTYSEIADQLNIAKDTSKTHIRNIYEKLKVGSKSEAIHKAKMQRWIKA